MAGYSYANKYLIYLLHHHLQIFIQQKDCYKNTQLGIGNSAYFLTICINFPQVKLRSFLVQLKCVLVGYSGVSLAIATQLAIQLSKLSLDTGSCEVDNQLASQLGKAGVYSKEQDKKKSTYDGVMWRLFFLIFTPKQILYPLIFITSSKDCVLVKLE